MSFWLIPLKEKGIDGLLLGVSRCYKYVMVKDMRPPAVGTYDLEGIATKSAGGGEQPALGLGFSCLVGDISREQTGEGFGCHGRGWELVVEFCNLCASYTTSTCYFSR